MAISRSSNRGASTRASSGHPAASGRQEVRGHVLYWEVHGGEGSPPIVLLHHGLGSARAWNAQIPAFLDAGWRVLVYDRWGYGQSDSRQGLDVPGFEADLEDLRALLDSRGLLEAALIGHSDGGTIALYFAARFPERVCALVTVAAHVYVEPSMVAGIQGVRAAFEGDRRFREGLRRAHDDKVDSVFQNWYDGWVRQEILGWDMRPLLKQITCPVLVIQGEADEHATPQHALDIAAAVPHANLWMIPGVAHMPPQEIPSEFNRRVLEFLAADGQRGVVDDGR